MKHINRTGPFKNQKYIFLTMFLNRLTRVTSSSVDESVLNVTCGVCVAGNPFFSSFSSFYLSCFPCRFRPFSSPISYPAHSSTSAFHHEETYSIASCKTIRVKI